MGEASLADPALLPDNFSCDHPDWRYRPGYRHDDTNDLLICDNLLDFSHLSYVPVATLGGSTEIARAAPRIEPITRGVRISRDIRNVPPSPYDQQFHPFDGPINRWIVYDFLIPGVLLMHSGGRPAQDADGDMARAVQLHSCQALTPETESSTPYFLQASHRTDQGNAATTQATFAPLLPAFEEDRAMICTQAENIALDPAAAMLALPMDRAVLRFRRLLEAQLQSERTAFAAQGR